MEETGGSASRLEELEAELEAIYLRKADVQLEINRIKRELDLERWRKVPVCDYNYYEVRGGKCKHGDTYHGSIVCEHIHCKR